MEDYKTAIEDYKRKWQNLLEGRKNRAYFEGLRPTSIAWKTTDRAELVKRCDELRDACDQIHFGWVNERWLVTLHLKEDVLPWGIRIIKLMERRPGSTDPIGLDHLDFYAKDAKAVAEQEPDLKWDEERNGEHCKWLSIWFAETEAKLRSDTVLQVCADEMLDFQEVLLRDL